MRLSVRFCEGPIGEPSPAADPGGGDGARLVFTGHIRGQEGERPISAIHYEIYDAMAEAEIGRLALSVANEWPVSGLDLIHRRGRVPVGEAAVRIAVASPRRREAIGFLEAFLNRLKADVPIWKTRHEWIEG